MIAGLDYGSKLAGTTVLSILHGKKITQYQSNKKDDADLMISNLIKSKKITSIFIDAPLSLPAILQNGKGSNFFYRKCDELTQAMSPMFIGGLTARAMKLAYEHKDVQFYETYPAYLLKTLNITLLKDEHISLQFEKIKKLFKGYKYEMPNNRHQIDSLLALKSHLRYLEGKALIIGDKKEGLIYI